MIYYAAAAWIVLINITAFALYGIDKLRAVKHQWRIPETTLIGLAALGGSIGAYAGMKIFHHKTLHVHFRVGIPAIIIIQLALLILLLIYQA